MIVQSQRQTECMTSTHTYECRHSQMYSKSTHTANTCTHRCTQNPSTQQTHADTHRCTQIHPHSKHMQTLTDVLKSIHIANTYRHSQMYSNPSTQQTHADTHNVLKSIHTANTCRHSQCTQIHPHSKHADTHNVLKSIHTATTHADIHRCTQIHPHSNHTCRLSQMYSNPSTQ